MIDPLERENRHLLEKLERTRQITTLSVLIEILTLRFWRLSSWILLFFGLWLFEIPAIFGYETELLTALLFFLGFGYFAYQDLRAINWPKKNLIDRRIEQESALRHRPLDALEDILANPKKEQTRTLWANNKSTIIKHLASLKSSLPKAFMAKTDPYALRFFAFILFASGAFIAGTDSWPRIAHGLNPVQIFDQEKLANQVLISITPPKYTKLAVINLRTEDADKSEKLIIPAGSTIKLRVHGGFGQPKLQIEDETWPLNEAGEDNYILEMPIPPGKAFKVSQFLITRAYWEYEIIEDTPPTITKNEDHEILTDSSIRMPLTVFDDYSVENLTLQMELDGLIETPPLGEPITETRSVFSPAETKFSIQPVFNLTAHPWAGLPVILYLEANDHLKQSAALEPIKLTLPEREFLHPVAKSLIAMRKKLAWNPESNYGEMANELEQLLLEPKFFGDDPVVFLSIRSAASRLYWSRPSKQTAKDLLSQLWDTAIRIEDGDLQLAARNLRDAQRALEDTLRNPESTDKDIREAMNDLREAMSEYFAELQKEFQKRMESGEPLPFLPPEMLAQSIDPDELANFLDQLEQQMLNGDRQSAQEMLSQLQRFMDMMDPSMSARLPPDIQMMNEGINELQELIDRQKDLLDQTEKQAELAGNFIPYDPIERELAPQTTPSDQSLFDQWGLSELPPPPTDLPDTQKEPEPSKQSLVNTQANKVEQEALRFILGQLMLDASEALEEIPETMGLAEQEMRGSSKHLGNNDPHRSIPRQEKAIEYLEQAQEELSQQMAERIQQITGMVAMGGGQRYDPLGRPYGGYGDQKGPFHGSRVKIPDEAERRRAQEILKMLRRRSSELNRPRDELDYFRRLLRQF